MGFNKVYSETQYDATIYLTPLGQAKLYNDGFFNGIKYFSISDHDANYLPYSGLTYSYNPYGPIYLSGSTEVYVHLGYVLNARGKVDEGVIVDRQMLPVKTEALKNFVWRRQVSGVPDSAGTTQVMEALFYKLSGVDKYFGKPIILGGDNMWKTWLSEDDNLSENFLRYDIPNADYIDYTSINEPTLGTVSSNLSTNTPFPGVSVTNSKRSKTEIQHFYFLNKSNEVFFIDSYSLINLFPLTHTIKEFSRDSDYSDDYIKDTFIIQWDALRNGTLFEDVAIHFYLPKFIYNSDVVVIYPFESIKFGVSFEVLTPGSTIFHWKGQTIENQLLNQGFYQYDFQLNIKTNPNGDVNRIARMNIITKVKDSGYDENTYVNNVISYETDPPVYSSGYSGSAEYSPNLGGGYETDPPIGTGGGVTGEFLTEIDYD